MAENLLPSQHTALAASQSLQGPRNLLTSMHAGRMRISVTDRPGRPRSVDDWSARGDLWTSVTRRS